MSQEQKSTKNLEELAHYTKGMFALDIFSVVSFSFVCAILFQRIFVSTSGFQWAAVVLGSLFGYLFADFFSGLVHWMFDTWWTIKTPVIGAAFVRPFREHHVDEKAITRHGFFEINGNNCLVSLPVLGMALLVSPASFFQIFVITSLLFICLGVFATNQFHKWSHLDNPTGIIALLQKYHLILPVDHHHIHHVFPHESHYCITTGWLNAPLNRIGFYRTLESIVQRTTGAIPRQDDLS